MEWVRSACHIRRQATGQVVWPGRVLGLSAVSLRYPTPGEETGFLLHSGEKLCNAWWKVMMIFVCIYVYWLACWMRFPDESDPAYWVLMTTFSMRTVCVLLALVHLVVMFTPRLFRSISASAREQNVMLMVLLVTSTNFGKYYMAKLHGHADPAEVLPELERYNDSIILMNFLTILMVSHSYLDVRWFVLVVAEIQVVAMYGIMVFLFGSPEPDSKLHFIHLIVLVTTIAAGKRQSEVNNRLLFSSFLAEKNSRVQAEFELSRCTSRSEHSRKADDEASSKASSCVTTTATGEVFTGIDTVVESRTNLDTVVESRSNLETIWEIGKKEQWLIAEHELVARPHECLGIGGFGVVIAGEFHCSPVALKLHIQNGNAKPLFSIGNELRLLRKLRHPNVVLFHGACLSVKHHDLVLVMERVVGESMVQFVARNPATGKRWKSLVDLCHALMYLHSRHPPIAHGDLKPANIIIERRSTGVHAKVLDFGFARLTTRSAKPGGGTYRWMAPGLLASGDAVQVEGDVYAFGLVMFFAATGRKPFAEFSDQALKAYAVGKDSAFPTLSWPGEVSAFATQCRSLVDSCMSQLRGDRPSMRQVYEVFHGFHATGSGAVAKSQPQCPAPPSPGLWPALFLARNIALAKQKAGRAARKRAAAPVEEPAASAATPVRLNCVPEQDAARDAATPAAPRPGNNCRHPAFHPTPTSTMIAAILDTMMSWNMEIPPGCCCEYHAAVQQLGTLCISLTDEACMRLTLPEMHTYQCPSCLRLIPDDDGRLEKLECQGCGYEGLPGHHIASM